ncbi:MAG: hypothetical protein U5L01_01960 [Rheinheimera sp.]|nr:hypothetical protein [Rheinheimera sp.]
MAHSKLELYKRKKGDNQMKDFNEKLKPAKDEKADKDAKTDEQP